MKICAWDIGIKHLAYCIMENNDNNDSNFKILHWEIIDLSPIESKYKCFLLKKCNKKISYIYDINDETKGLCKFHYDELKKNISDNFVKNNNKEICNGILKNNTIETCNNKSLYLMKNKNKTFCGKHKKENLNSVIEEYNFKKILKSSNMSYMELCKQLYFQLIKRNDYILNVDEIIIENQPSYINPVMKSISTLLYGFYVYNMMTKQTNIKNIKYESPMNKLKLEEIHGLNQEKIKIIKNLIITQNEKIKTKKNKKDENNDKKEDDENNDKKDKDKDKENENEIDVLKKMMTYKMTKQISIEYCRLLLDYFDEKIKWETYFSKFSKKDDLSDCFLFAYNYIQKHKS